MYVFLIFLNVALVWTDNFNFVLWDGSMKLFKTGTIKSDVAYIFFSFQNDPGFWFGCNKCHDWWKKRSTEKNKKCFVICFVITYRNHKLALCLVHLLKTYGDLAAIDVLLLSILKCSILVQWKKAVFKNAKVLQNMTPLKILKACTTWWLTHGKISISVNLNP